MPASIAVTPKTVVDGINSWARVNHAKEIALEDVMALKDSTTCTVEEKNIGMPLEPGCGETIQRDGLTHYIGSLKSEDGIVRTRIMCSMNMPHWPTPRCPARLSSSSPTSPGIPKPRKASITNKPQIRFVCMSEKACCDLQQAFSNFLGASLHFRA